MLESTVNNLEKAKGGKDSERMKEKVSAIFPAEEMNNFRGRLESYYTQLETYQKQRIITQKAQKDFVAGLESMKNLKMKEKGLAGEADTIISKIQIADEASKKVNEKKEHLMNALTVLRSVFQ